jgi:23S rRNA pseudouridine2605 synthase
LTHSHDSDSPESERPVRADEAHGQADAGERTRNDEPAEGEDRPRRGLRRGPRSLIARRRAVAPPDGVVAAQVRMPRKDAGSRGPRNGAGGADGARAGSTAKPRIPREGSADGAREGQAPREGGRRPPRQAQQPGQAQKRGRRDDAATPAMPAATTAAAGTEDDVFAYVTSPAFDADNTSGSVGAPMLRRGRSAPQKRG